jgi:hypothetical protein
MRVWVEKGFLIQPQSFEHDGREYTIPLEFRVFNEDGTPSTGSYRGEGSIRGTRLLLGDPYRSADLAEYVVETTATQESWDYYQGFKTAVSDRFAKRFAKGMFAPGLFDESSRWMDGYVQGRREKKAAKKSSNRVEVRDAFGVRARPRSLVAAHRVTRRANMAGTSVSKSHNMAERHGVRLTAHGKKFGYDITLTEWICELREELLHRGIADDAVDDFIQQRGDRLKEMWQAGQDRYDVANNVDEALGRSGFCEDCGEYH